MLCLSWVLNISSSMQVVFVCHGSKDITSVAEFLYLVDLFKMRHTFIKVGYWIMEFSKVSFRKCACFIESIIMIVPIIMCNSGHIKKDICVLCNSLQLCFNKKSFLCVQCLYLWILNVKSLCFLLKSLIRHNSLNCVRTVVLLVARGASDIEFNIWVHGIAKAVWEGLGCFWCEVSYIGICYPLFDFVKELFKRSDILIFVPLLLTFGQLYKRFVEFKNVTDYLFNNKSVVGMFFKTLWKFFEDISYSCCSVCKYKRLC